MLLGIYLMAFCFSTSEFSGADTTYFKWRYEVYNKERRDPGLSFILSWMIPGTGQFYNGDFQKGILCLVTDFLLCGLIAYTGHELRLDHHRIDEHPYNTLGAVSLFAHKMISSNDAHLSSVVRNKELKLKYGIYQDIYDEVK